MKNSRLGLQLFIKYEVVVASGLVICVNLVLIVLLLIPNILKMDSIIRENDSLSEKINRLKNKETALSLIQAENYKNRYKKIQSVLPSSSDYVSMLDTLNSLEQKTGAIIQTTDFKTPQEIGDSGISDELQQSTASGNPIWLTMGLAGSYDQLKAFLDGLNKLDGRIFNLYRANYIKNDDGSEQLQIVTSTYSYKLNTELGPVDSALPEFDEKKKTMLSKIDSIQDASRSSEPTSTQSGKIDLFN